MAPVPNADLARLFDEMAAVIQITGGNSFRASAHARVARVLEELPDDVADLAAEPGKLLEIEGIGEGSARRISEYVRTGRIREHDQLLETVPRGLLELLRIPGLGPKTVRLLWEKGGVTDLASLRAKLATGELEELPRLGPKSLANIREAIAFTEAAGKRFPLGEALPLAESIVEFLRRAPGSARVEYAGSLRRGRETIGDIDVLASTSDPAGLAEAFRSMDGVSRVLAAGETKSSVRLDAGIQVDLRIVPAASFGAALLYFTGSKEHNVAVRERAVKMGYRLNEYGLFRDGAQEGPPPPGAEPVAARTEEEVYAALGLPWIPPELREDRGEIGLAETPRLIEAGDIRAELHAHTVASDGHLTIEALVAEAARRGFHTIAITDHSKSAIQANGLDPPRLVRHVEEIRRVARRTRGIRVLAGAEVDILSDGRLDYDDELLALLDIVVASPHVALRQDPGAATERLLAAVRHPLVHVLGHPTGRLITRREGLAPDMAAIAGAAAASGTALEINANSWRLDLRDSHVRAAVDAGALLALNTDAHSAADLDQLRYGVLTARRGWLAPERCINAWSARELHAWLARKRPARS